MPAFNRVILMGNVTRQVKLQCTQSDTPVTDLGLAVNERRKNQHGELVETTTFCDVVLFGRTAEIAAEYLGTGCPVLIEGRLRLDTWEKNGQMRSKLKIICERMQMLGRADANANTSEMLSTDDDVSEHTTPF